MPRADAQICWLGFRHVREAETHTRLALDFYPDSAYGVFCLALSISMDRDSDR